jgi:hypothetical protein
MREIEAIRLVYDRNTRQFETPAEPLERAGCRVQAKFDDDGNLIYVGCTNDSCSGSCLLQEKDNGNGKITYTCDCRVS